MIATTIVARNYLAQACVVSESFLAHNPAGTFFTLVVDGTEDDRQNNPTSGNIVLPTDLHSQDFEMMAAIYEVMELSTALKPHLLKHLIQRSGESIIYLDPDIEVFGSLELVFEALNHADIVLTPHTLTPLPRDGLETSERTIRHAGIFNLGFIGVSPGAVAMLDWWHERLRTDAVVDLENALFTDQRWMDFAPSLWNVKVLKHPGLNVAYWNIHERELSQQDDEILVNGEQLLFFHFSGFDPVTPWLLTKHTGVKSRCFVGDNEILVRLSSNYAQLLTERNHSQRKMTPYGLGSSASGIVLSPLIRRLLRNEWIKFLAGDSETPPPSPFSTSKVDALLEWLGLPLFGVIGYRQSRLERQVWLERPDLQHHFQDPLCEDSIPFRKWLDDDPHTRALMAPIPARVASQTQVRPLTPNGWNVVGYFSAELGVGEAGRRIADVIKAVGLPVEHIGVSADSSRKNHLSHVKVSDNPKYQNTLFAVNADQTKRVIKLSGMAQHPRSRRIGLWFWELEKFPNIWSSVFDDLDEIWCASEFTFASVQSASSIPTRLIRLPVQAPTAQAYFARHETFLPDEFTFLFTYDFNSVMERKNPLAAVHAYTRAFEPGDGAHLVLKSINGHQHRNELARIKFLTAHRPDITVLDAYTTQSLVEAQIAHCDCFVSLHRSEGFGLNIATAIAAGVPTIATGYGGNMTFTRSNDPLLIRYDLQPVGEGADPYPADSVWAAPDVDQASRLMRFVFDENHQARQWADESRRYLLERNSIRSCAEFISDILIGEGLVTS